MSDELYVDVFMACADLVGRAGAKSFDFGYMNEEAKTVEDAQWYASAQYKGTRFFVDNHASPTEAAMALAEKIMRGAMCKCGERVTLTDGVPGCRWLLMGKRWEPSCDVEPIRVNGERGDGAAISASAEAVWANRATRRTASQGRKVPVSEMRRRNRRRK